MRQLNTMFNSKSNATFNNKMFSSSTVAVMHIQMERLYRAAKILKNIEGQSNLARFLNASPQTVKNWEERGVSKQGLLKAQDVIGCSATWVETGTGQMVFGENIELGPDFKSERKYPVISWVQAGSWTEICDNFQPGDSDEWRPCHKDLGKCGYVLRVRGPSMTAQPGAPYTFPEGMLLYVNPELEATPGRFVIVRRNKNNEATFKKLIVHEGELYLEALNPSWPYKYLKLEEGDQFCGVVVSAGFEMP